MERPTVKMEFPFGYIGDIRTRAMLCALTQKADISFEFNHVIKTVTYDEAKEALPQIVTDRLESLNTSERQIANKIRAHRKELEDIVELLLPLAMNSL